MLKEEKEKIKEYFVSFNMMDDDSCLCLKIPDKWIIPDEIDESVFINNERKKEGIYFLCTDSDPLKLFKVANDIIELNKIIEEKRILFTQKIQELEEIFNKRSIDELKNLEFRFFLDSTDTFVSKKPYVKPLVKVEDKSDVKTEKPNKSNQKKENKKVSSMMSEAKKIAEE